MIRPEVVWHVLDTLAYERGLTPSGLAKAAGLDATTFNPSRRIAGHGGYRWPAMPSLLAALAVLHVPWSVFAQQVEGQQAGGMAQSYTVRPMPCLPLSRLSDVQLYNDHGCPQAVRWDQAVLPQGVPEGVYGVKIDTYALEPTLREGGVLVVMPDLKPRFSDRVLLVRHACKPIVGLMQGQESIVVQDLSAQASLGGGLVVVEAGSGAILHRIIMVTF